jgi:gamma-tubulin complex component 2
MYVAVNLEQQIATSTGHHPILYVSDPNLIFQNDANMVKPEELILLKYDDRESTDTAQFGQSVCLMTTQGYYLTFKADGSLRVEKNERYDDGSNSIARLTKWTLVDARNTANRAEVSHLNDCAFKSPFGNYLQVLETEVLCANGLEILRDCIFKVVRSNIPHLPDWVYKRPYLNFNNITAQYQPYIENSQQHKRQRQDRLQEEVPTQLGSFSAEIQETFLIEDLLFAMTSIEGSYIRRNLVRLPSGEYRKEFAVEPHLDQPTCDFSLMFLIQKMLPLCNNHDIVQEFVNVHSQFEYGLVSHALCSSIRVLCKEYLLLCTQLDAEFNHGDLTLQKIWFYVQNSIRVMESLKRLVIEAGQRKGGALLNVIYKLMINSSDKAVRDLYEFLLEKSSAPYLDILKKWIFQGILDDNFEEFLVSENNEFKKEQVSQDLNNLYWL